MNKKKTDGSHRRQKVQSAEVGSRVLKALGQLGRSASLSQVAEAAGMHSAKAYRYLQALVSSGFVAQDPANAQYRLGFESLHLGLSAIRQIDVVASASEIMLQLEVQRGETYSLAVWANRGPTVVKVLDSPLADSLVTRMGTVLPLLTSAAGHVFVAFLPQSDTAALLNAELLRLPSANQRRKEARLLRTRTEKVRQTGVGIVRELNFPGIDAVSIPIFDASGSLKAALNMLGVASHLDLTLKGRSVSALRAAAFQISQLLGYQAAT